MGRKNFGLGIGLFLAAILVTPLEGKTPSPNIVLVVLDDLDASVTEPFFAEVLRRTTQLQSEGAYFSQAYSPTAICCAARASILTGKYAHNTGVLTNGGKFGGYPAFKEGNNESQTIAKYLHDRGYRTAAIGKYLNGYAVEKGEKPTAPPIPEGWSEWRVFVDRSLTSYTGYEYRLLEWKEGSESSIKYYGKNPSDYSTDVLKEHALHFIDGAKKDEKPLFLYLTPTAPHFPLKAAPRHMKSATEKWAKVMPPAERPNFFSDGKSIEDKPFWLRSTWGDRTSWQSRLWNRWDWINRMGSLYAADEMIGALVDRLKANRQWENTLFIVVSDNGYNMGAHSLLHKMAPYEESIHVPLWIVGGANLDVIPTLKEKNFALLIDLAPTILDYAGKDIPADVDGRSLRPLLNQKAQSWRSSFLIEYYGGGNAEGIATEIPMLLAPSLVLDIPSYRGIRARVEGQDVTYVEWEKLDSEDRFLRSEADFELYNLSKDPFQLDNLLYYSPKPNESLRKLLAARLKKLSQCRGARCG